MRVTINGRDINERMITLEQQELRYFEIIKSAACIIVGTFLIICLPGVFHIITDLPVGFGAHVIDAFKSFR